MSSIGRSHLAKTFVFTVAVAFGARAAAQPVATAPGERAWAARTAEARRVADARWAADLAAAEARAVEAPRIAARAAAQAAASARAAAASAWATASAQAAAGARSHLFVPEAQADLVAAQALVVRRHFGTVGRRGRQYFPMIERALARRGLPQDLKYVAVIESALNPDAISPAGAAGMWQFMPATAQDFGLDSLAVHDPTRATDAAALYLEQLGRAFGGDWQLALAAYNCGWGRVRRLVDAHRARTGFTPTFWDLHDALPAETRAYVPRFIAVAEHFETVGA